MLVVNSVALTSREFDLYYGYVDSSGYGKKYVDLPVVGTVDKGAVVGTVRVVLLNDSMGGKIVFDERIKLDENTISSVVEAIKFAEKRLETSSSYFISYDMGSSFISGKSSGAMIALGVFTLHTNISFPSDIIVSGEIDGNGNLYDVGGKFLKLLAIRERGIRNVVIANTSEYIYLKKKNRVLARNVNLQNYFPEINFTVIKNLDSLLFLLFSLD